MVVIMLGAPGTGKGTVSSILTKELEIPAISTGEIFRKNIKEGTKLGKLANEYMAKGQLVPDEVTVKIVEDRLGQSDVKNGAILDGFPRTVEQAKQLDEILAKRGESVHTVINLSTPKEELIERIINRRVCSNSECKAIFNIVLNPPKQEGICDKCGSTLLHREDDNIDTFENRLQSYEKQTSPLVNYYQEKGILHLVEVSKQTGKMGQEVAMDIVKYIKGEA